MLLNFSDWLLVDAANTLIDKWGRTSYGIQTAPVDQPAAPLVKIPHKTSFVVKGEGNLGNNNGL